MMRKYIYLLLLCSVINAQYSFAQTTTIQHIGGRAVTSLNGQWNYIIDPYENGFYDYRREPFDQADTSFGGYFRDRSVKAKNDLIEYDFDHAPTLNVPSDWNSQSEKLEFYEGTIWYRRKFTVQVKARKRYFLHFGAVNYEAHIYLNGKKLGVHKGGFSAFQFEVTGKLLDGQNTLVVKADNTRKPDEVPTVNTDWWNYGGITRNVCVAELPETFVADYKLQLAKEDLTKLTGYIQLDGQDKLKSISLNIPEAGIQTRLKPDANGRAQVSLPIKKLTYWTPENPKLYSVSLQLDDELITDRIGFRTIAVKGTDILLNGKPVFLRGICLHDENPLLPGRTRSAGDLRMLLTWAKELNCNFVRLAHYQHNEEMLRLADELGIMVWAEVPVYWTISWQNPATYQNAEQQLTDLINRDMNRASAIVWSIGNETPVSEPRLKFMGNLAAKARQLDNTRLVAAALEVRREGNTMIVDDPLGEKLDLASFNEYAGWYWGGEPSEITKWNFNIKYNKPVIITEFGGEALAGHHTDSTSRWSEEYQANLYKNQITMLSKIKALRGMTPWILADFRSPRRPHSVYQNYWNRKGLISETGTKKQAFYVLQAFYSQLQLKNNYTLKP